MGKRGKGGLQMMRFYVLLDIRSYGLRTKPRPCFPPTIREGVPSGTEGNSLLIGTGDRIR